MPTASESPKLHSQRYGQMLRYRDQLLEFGMQEAVMWKPSIYQQTWYYFKPATELTAFIINLTGHENALEIVFGYASTAFTRMAGNADALRQLGVSSQDITIRERILLSDGDDDSLVSTQVAAMYRRYQNVEKEDLLFLAKAKRKVFLSQITDRLKPLGFRKKANTWIRPLEGDYVLELNLQKSLYSDEYYYNVSIGGCYYSRLTSTESPLVDWQLFPPEEMDAFWETRLFPFFTRVIQTPLAQLGKDPIIWANCNCNRKRCPHCWVAQNRWGQ